MDTYLLLLSRVLTYPLSTGTFEPMAFQHQVHLHAEAYLPRISDDMLATHQNPPPTISKPPSSTQKFVAFEGHFGGELWCSIEHGGLCASHWTNGAPPWAHSRMRSFPYSFWPTRNGIPDHSVDGRNPANQLRLVVYPIIYRDFIATLPSTVSPEM